jgi:choline dehydrogenase
MVFDHVIVGAGSAGCVLANRLSEDPHCRVALLEAGGEPDTNLVDIPGAASWMQGTRLDWAFTTAPQRELHDRRIPYPRGRVLGGTSVLNYMVYARGNRGDYYFWAQLGNTGWGYDDVLTYFKKSERNAVFSDAFHGVDGPLSVETTAHRHPLCDLFLEAAQSVGVPYNPDFNGAAQDGCGYYQATVKNGRRCSTAKAFLDPVRNRSNLTVIPNALATRLLVERDHVRGVEYVAEGRSIEVAAADRSVICAGGAIGSPHLLMLSGIGPAEHLRHHGVKVVHDLPGVGRNLQDHLSSGSVQMRLKEPHVAFADSPERFEDAVRRFKASGDGVLATHFLDVGAFLKVDPGEEEPSIQCFFTPGVSEFYRIDGRLDHRHVYTAAIVCRPKSRGSVTLASSSPLDPPVIDPNYLSDPDDLRLTVAGLRRVIEIFQAKPFDAIREGEVKPGQESDAELGTFVRRNASTIWHPTSTCCMGIDERAVVGPDLKVRGLTGLRVCDASIMPAIVSANTNAPTIMIAERGADMIKAATA